jgi:hypothetical protein
MSLSPIQARSRLAVLSRASTKATPEEIAEARRALTEAKLAQAIDEALKAEPALHPSQRSRLAGLLVVGAR